MFSGVPPSEDLHFSLGLSLVMRNTTVGAGKVHVWVKLCWAAEGAGFVVRASLGWNGAVLK